MFLDVADIHVASGKGGAGAVSVRREKYVPKGGPDGGNGGRGGSVWFEATTGLTTLQDFRYRRRYAAGDGQPGGGKRSSGADGQDVVIRVPCGTLIYDGAAGTLLGDLTEPGQRLLAAGGGRGGKGNWEFRTARNQTPMHAQPGEAGVALAIRLELKLIADVGLVGLPNAGKSTMLSVLTAARPKIADYPFTTLVPNLGIVDLGEGRSCALADIPGLIEGASGGRGLGHEFLRHVERTRALLLLVDAAAGAVAPTLDVLLKELAGYGRRLQELPRAVVLTKGDLMDEAAAAAALAEARAWARTCGAAEVAAVSAATGAGLPALRMLILRLYGGPAAP